jgi:hypothetical protein
VSTAASTGDDVCTTEELPEYPDLGDTMSSTMVFYTIYIINNI